MNLKLSRVAIVAWLITVGIIGSLPLHARLVELVRESVCRAKLILPFQIHAQEEFQ
jgi:hypothetical protein